MKSRKRKSLKNRLTIKIKTQRKKEDTSKNAVIKDNNLKKVSEKKKESKTKTKETKNPVFIFGAEARKSVLGGGKSEEIRKS